VSSEKIDLWVANSVPLALLHMPELESVPLSGQEALHYELLNCHRAIWRKVFPMALCGGIR